VEIHGMELTLEEEWEEITWDDSGMFAGLTEAV